MDNLGVPLFQETSICSALEWAKEMHPRKPLKHLPFSKQARYCQPACSHSMHHPRIANFFKSSSFGLDGTLAIPD